MTDRMYYSREAEEMAQRERITLAMLVLALGVGLGAAITLLFAPQPGSAIRRALADQAERVVDNGMDTATNVAGRLQKDISKLAGDVKERLVS